MSHTHANVDTIGFYGYYPKNYVEHILNQTEAAVIEADKNLAPVAALNLGSVEMPLTGGRVIDLILNWRETGLHDPTVSVLQAVGQDGKPILNLIHLACHPEVIKLERERGLSPDFVGTLCNEVHRAIGGQSVFLNGALGGMVSPDTKARTQTAAAAMGKGLARYAITAAKNATPSTNFDVYFQRQPVEYPITSELILKFLKNAPGPVNMYEGRIRTEMNLAWVGDAQFITIPGELLPEPGLHIKGKMVGRLSMVVGLTNDEAGYLIPSYNFRAGGYEERTGPGAAAGDITRMLGLELAPIRPR
jgi:hypothetical protein